MSLQTIVDIPNPQTELVGATAVADSPRPPVYTSAELLQGHREVWIEHGDQMYRLRLTHAQRLYLTK